MKLSLVSFVLVAGCAGGPAPSSSPMGDPTSPIGETPMAAPMGSALSCSCSAGAAGPEGPAGKSGAQGPAGVQGPPGADGAPGLPGTAGAPGVPGLPGTVGPQGPAGLVGSQGPAGAVGPSGASGPQGPAGAKGATGATGATGPQGVVGDKTHFYVVTVSAPIPASGGAVLAACSKISDAVVGGSCAGGPGISITASSAEFVGNANAQSDWKCAGLFPGSASGGQITATAICLILP